MIVTTIKLSIRTQ